MTQAELEQKHNDDLNRENQRIIDAQQEYVNQQAINENS